MNRGMTAAALAALVIIGGCKKLEQRADRPQEPKTEMANNSAPATTPTGPTIPVAYQGEWNINRDNCGSDEGRLLVQPNSISFFKTQAALDTVKPLGDRAVDVVARVTDSTGDWALRNSFTLSPDGQTLTVKGAQGEPPVMQRCPGNRT